MAVEYPATSKTSFAPIKRHKSAFPTLSCTGSFQSVQRSFTKRQFKPRAGATPATCRFD
jgi:hypothetical protein